MAGRFPALAQRERAPCGRDAQPARSGCPRFATICPRPALDPPPGRRSRRAKWLPSVLLPWMSTVEHLRAGAADAPATDTGRRPARWTTTMSPTVPPLRFGSVSFLSWSAAVSMRKHRGRWSWGVFMRSSMNAASLNVYTHDVCWRPDRPERPSLG
ncbi:MAG: hypothetical protein OJF55_002580 [Rhodanobacteraceae bacterium]|nr:MAG: hypothetical protein OJF55_002580 [Rhodanobacteraceae bacterium]